MNCVNIIRAVHYNNKLFEDMKREQTTSLYTLTEPFFMDYEEILLFAYLLKDNASVHNLNVYFINHHALPKEFQADDTYIKVITSFENYKSFDGIKKEWYELDCPPIQIRFSLDEENTQRIEFTDASVFGCTKPTDKLYYCGFAIATFFQNNTEDADMTLKKEVIDKTLLKIIEDYDHFDYGIKAYA